MWNNQIRTLPLITIVLAGLVLPSELLSTEDKTTGFIPSGVTTAVVGLFGVIVGGFISIGKDWWLDWKKRRADAYFSAIRLVCLLEEYVVVCCKVVGDDENNHYNPELQSFAIGTPNPPVLPDDVIWKSLEPTLLYEIMTLPGKAQRTNGTIAFLKFNQIGDWFGTRTKCYITLGLCALEAANSLRNKYDISNSFNSEDLVNDLEKEKRYLLKAKAKIEDTEKKPAASSNIEF